MIFFAAGSGKGRILEKMGPTLCVKPSGFSSSQKTPQKECKNPTKNTIFVGISMQKTTKKATSVGFNIQKPTKKNQLLLGLSQASIWFHLKKNQQKPNSTFFCGARKAKHLGKTPRCQWMVCRDKTLEGHDS